MAATLSAVMSTARSPGAPNSGISAPPVIVAQRSAGTMKRPSARVALRHEASVCNSNSHRSSFVLGLRSGLRGRFQRLRRPISHARRASKRPFIDCVMIFKDNIVISKVRCQVAKRPEVHFVRCPRLSSKRHWPCDLARPGKSRACSTADEADGPCRCGRAELAGD